MGGPMQWSEAHWIQLMDDVRRRALISPESRGIVVKAARYVMRSFTTGFFMASRFLPPVKRGKVELIYAAVRYPDEVVDTFPLSREKKRERLDGWAEAYERALKCSDLRSALATGVPCFVAGFVDVVRSCRIPVEHYREFLSAMRQDIDPRPYRDLNDLVQRYIYGSAVVVGYCLAHVYGVSAADRWGEALVAARQLGIALQLTNFARDAAEDNMRGRQYVPQCYLRNGHWESPGARRDAVRLLAMEAEELYAAAEQRLEAFAVDCQPAIRTCLRAYGMLNQAILRREDAGRVRISVPFLKKWGALPRNKYWKIPMAYLEPLGFHI